jgi:hypothetical protein
VGGWGAVVVLVHCRLVVVAWRWDLPGVVQLVAATSLVVPVVVPVSAGVVVGRQGLALGSSATAGAHPAHTCGSS